MREGTLKEANSTPSPQYLELVDELVGCADSVGPDVNVDIILL
jgi:hypothetical protein